MTLQNIVDMKRFMWYNICINKICYSHMNINLTHISVVDLFAKSEMVFSSVQLSRSVVSDSLRPHEWQHTRPPCPSPTLGV